MSLPAISKHLRVLARSGLIVRQKDGRLRRCRLEPGPLHAVAAWLAAFRHTRPWHL